MHEDTGILNDLVRKEKTLTNNLNTSRHMHTAPQFVHCAPQSLLEVHHAFKDLSKPHDTALQHPDQHLSTPLFSHHKYSLYHCKRNPDRTPTPAVHSGRFSRVYRHSSLSALPRNTRLPAPFPQHLNIFCALTGQNIPIAPRSSRSSILIVLTFPCTPTTTAGAVVLLVISLVSKLACGSTSGSGAGGGTGTQARSHRSPAKLVCEAGFRGCGSHWLTGGQVQSRGLFSEPCATHDRRAQRLAWATCRHTA